MCERTINVCLRFMKRKKNEFEQNKCAENVIVFVIKLIYLRVWRYKRGN